MSYEQEPAPISDQAHTQRTYDPARRKRHHKIVASLGGQDARGQRARQQRWHAGRDLGQTVMRGALAEVKPERSREC